MYVYIECLLAVVISSWGVVGSATKLKSIKLLDAVAKSYILFLFTFFSYFILYCYLFYYFINCFIYFFSYY